MTTARSRTTLVRTLAVTALAALTLAGCGSGGDGSSGGASPSGEAIAPAARDDALAAKVPQSIKADGKLVYGTDASYPPNEFTAPDGTTVIGMEVDLGTAIAQKLGLTPEFQNSQFSGIIPGIQGGKYEAGISSFTINDERTKTVDMVSYFSAGTSLATKKGNPDGINPENLCGQAVGVQAGTVQVEDIAARSKACTDRGQAGDRGHRAAAADRRDAGADVEPGRRHARRLPGRRLRRQDDERRRRGRRPALRHRALRRGAEEGPGPVPGGGPGRHPGPDRGRHVHEDPGQVGVGNGAIPTSEIKG